MTRPVAVLGATFDPPHAGHWDSVAQVYPEAAGVWLLPSASHAFGKQPVAWAHRLAMLELGQHHWSATQPVVICPLEAELLAAQGGQGPIYTYPVLQELQRRLQQPVRLVIGPDNAQPQVWARFHEAEALARDFQPWVVAERVPGRSSLCRAALARAWRGELDFAALYPLLGAPVVDYIRTQGLYQALP